MTSPQHRLTGHGVPHLDHAERTAVGALRDALRAHDKATRAYVQAPGFLSSVSATAALRRLTTARADLLTARDALDAALMVDA